MCTASAPGEYRVIGRTRDDAAGEAFDKVARMLGLSYPGGPAIQRAAAGRAASPFELPRAWLPGTSDFSFSGLKTAVWRLVHDQLGPVEAARIRAADHGAAGIDDAEFVADVAHAFEVSVVDVLVTKTVRAAKRMRAAAITLTGGVAANARLRAALTAAAPVPCTCRRSGTAWTTPA